MDTITQRMNRLRLIARDTFGARIWPWIVGFVLFSQRIAINLFRALDPIFFPAIKTQQVKAPIVLIGNPRTGTTFMQRFLTDHGIGAGMELFRMVYPSLLMQTLIKPFLPLMEAVSPAKYHKPEVHATNLSKVETDDASFATRFVDGFFLYCFFLVFDDEDLLPSFDPKVRDTSKRDFDYVEGLWRRNLIAHKADRVVAKLFSVSPRVPQFLERFPDAKLLYMARDPVSIFPSGMSLVTGVLEEAFQFWSLPEATRQRWFDRIYKGFVMLLERFHEDYTSGRIPAENVYVVRYDRMMKEFEVVMAEILEFLGEEPSEELLATIAARGEKQRAYKSKHKYDLAKFNLDEERIRRDCAFFYDTFLPPLPHLEEEEEQSA
ncbi:MAG: sulfotransferase [Alphaproteobacteria bacterium]|nr:sulfotransferase [Alphaproteobacteria bacterium]